MPFGASPGDAGKRVTVTWANVWATALYDLHVPSAEIGKLNFKKYAALLKRKQEADDLLRLNAGYIYAAIYNCAPFADPKRKAVQPTEILPESSPSKPKPADMTKMSPKAQKNYLFWVFQGQGKRTM